MKPPTQILVAALPSALAAALACSTIYLRGSDDAKKQPAAKTVPIKDIYSTSEQEGQTYIYFVSDNTFRRDLDALCTRATGIGASNVFLVRGANLGSAVQSTYYAYLVGQSVSTPVISERHAPKDPFWLVAYLGVSGSSLPNWMVESVRLHEQHITFTYRYEGADSKDRHPYFYWVPLGRLEPGEYMLDLVDADRQDFVLRRRVTVPRE